MLRRTVLQRIAGACGLLPFPAFRVWAQTITFPGKHQATLRGIASIVLPAELGRDGAEQVADQFESWVRGYRSGAAMESGYGFPRLRSKPASPAPAYVTQLETLAGADRAAVEAALDKAGIKELPRQPDGRNVIADLMSFYFHSSDANDLCYRAAIRREDCRGLPGSDNPPPPLKGRA
jgi:hypothetical protein